MLDDAGVGVQQEGDYIYLSDIFKAGVVSADATALYRLPNGFRNAAR